MTTNPGCHNCMKLALHGKSVCIDCKTVAANEIFDIGSEMLGFNLPPDIAEEARYEIFCKLKGKESVTRVEIGLAKIIAKCADTVVYLNRGKEDLAVLDFDIKHNEAYITNGDLIVRIANVDSYLVSSLDPERTAYGYYDEKFIPSPLPMSKEEMAKAFAGDFLFSFSLPVEPLLEFMFARMDSPIKRRSSILVMDVGQAYMENDLIIPEFRYTKEGVFGVVPGLDIPVMVASGSKLNPHLLDPDSTYITHIVGKDKGVIYVDVYKKFEPVVKLGMYELLGPNLDSQLHPFDLDSFAAPDRLNVPLTAFAENFRDRLDSYIAYKGFWPIAINGEYLFETLLLYRGFEFINVYVGVPGTPIIIEGLRPDPQMPSIETVMHQTIIGILDKPEVV